MNNNDKVWEIIDGYARDLTRQVSDQNQGKKPEERITQEQAEDKFVKGAQGIIRILDTKD